MEESSPPQLSPQSKQRPGVKQKSSRSKMQDKSTPSKRRCVSTACIACRKRKSKVCVYDPNSDHRRKGVYKQDIDNLRNRNTTLQTLVEAILNYDEEDIPELVRQIRSSENLEVLAESLLLRQQNLDIVLNDKSPNSQETDTPYTGDIPRFESELAGKISELRLDGAVKYVGGTSNLIFLPEITEAEEKANTGFSGDEINGDEAITSWTTVTNNKELIRHLLTMYFTWHYAYFTALSKKLFYRDFTLGRSTQHCSPLLVNAMLALACHFSTWPSARENPNDSATAGDHFFREAKRLFLDNDEHEKAKLCTVQALALMSVREAGCGREGSGWVYSGMSFRMAYDLGLNVDSAGLSSHSLSAEDIDARRITFWGCFLFDKCWSNYLGRQPQLSGSHITVPKFDVFPDEDAETWSPYTDGGVSMDHNQPSRTRAVALQISKLCEISGDLLSTFYHPAPSKQMGKQEELRRLSHLHTRLESWRQGLPKELDHKDGQLPQVLIMHMFFHLLFIHLYRPFLKYTKSTSPLPSHVSPRKICTQSASQISKLFRIYKRSYGLRQICNLAIYIAHSACTIHLLNLPDKSARRDILHGLKQLEEMAEGWLCARRTLRILDLAAKKWNIVLPDEATVILDRARSKFGSCSVWERMQSPSSSEGSPKVVNSAQRCFSSTYRSTSEKISSTSAHTAPQPIGPPLTSQPMQEQYIYPPTQYPQNKPVHIQPIVIKQENTSDDNLVLPPSPYRVLSEQETPVGTTQASPIPLFGVGGDVSLESPQPPPFINTDKLVEASQNWWLRDQSALALGMDNWSADTWNTQGERCSSTDFGTSGGVAATSGDVYTIDATSPPLPASELVSGVDLGMALPITSADGYSSYIPTHSGPPQPNQGYGRYQNEQTYDAARELFY
ncbi:hypothetical protein FQN57_007487 [Myotisia sp. PD_48]|nr:hypothetical protein FQN57_007487 [Myotisia sp. PD_48]